MVVIYLQARRDASERIHVLGADAWEGQTVAEVFAAMQRHGYVFAEHLMPHDSETRNVATRTTPAQVMRGLGQRVRVVPRDELLRGINAVRAPFPRLVFDRRRCATLLEMLGAYIKAWDATGKVFKPTPRHNQASHYADALRCFAMGYREPREVNAKGAPEVRDQQNLRI
jgi:phage terminase large subunit